MKTVLITGSTGFIGSHLVKTLINFKKYRIKIFIRKQSNLSRLGKLLHKVEIFRGDFASEEDIKKSLKGVDIFIHLASVLGRGRKEDYLNFNIKTSERFFYYAVKNKVKKIIFLSSFEVMGGSKDICFYSEKDKPNPLTSYGKSKYEVEKIAQKYIKRHNLNITILRVPAVYGPNDNFDRGFIRLIDLVASNKFIPFGKMNNYMALIYIENLIDVILNCLENKKSNKQVYFVADKEILKALDIYYLIIKLCKVKESLITLPKFVVKGLELLFETSAKIFNFLPFYPENIVHNFTVNYACSTAKIEKELNWTPSYTIYKGMKKTIQWYRKVKV